MASATASKKMREEATCSICLQLMTEPMNIDCGHSFCRLCLMKILENKIPVMFGGGSHCPLCKVIFRRESLRPNKQLENLIETIKEMDHEKLCEEHGEQLQLFCEDDHQFICWRCERAPQHKGHVITLVEDVREGYKEKLQKALVYLKDREALCDSLKLFTREQIIEWKENIELQRRKIHSDFENLHNFLHKEETYYLCKLQEEKEEILRKLQEGEANLEKQSCELRNHILELEKKCEGSAQKLLQDMNDTLKRSLTVQLKAPEIVSLEVHTMCNVSELYFDVKNNSHSSNTS